MLYISRVFAAASIVLESQDQQLAPTFIEHLHPRHCVWAQT